MRGCSPRRSARSGAASGLDMRSMAVVFEAAGYSLLGPQALNCAAPDEGNMHLLEVVASEAQKAGWLRPLAAGHIRSCFSMTEPDGAGSDPGMLAATARQDGNHWVISGRKWFITGYEGAKLNIVMARTSDRIERGRGATMFLVDNDDPAIEAVRRQETLESSFAGGHYELRFNDLRVNADQVLGEIGEGYRYAQVRLAPARLTHCMRWLGAAKRAHDIACGYAVRREAFGKPLAEHEGVGFMLADNELDMHLARLVIWQAAWVLDQGGQARQESSMAKVFCSEAEFRVIDRCMQILGGMGITTDTLVERLWREVRPFRIYDGPNEVHRWAIARRIAKGARSGALMRGRMPVGCVAAEERPIGSPKRPDCRSRRLRDLHAVPQWSAARRCRASVTALAIPAAGCASGALHPGSMPMSPPRRALRPGGCAGSDASPHRSRRPGLQARRPVSRSPRHCRTEPSGSPCPSMCSSVTGRPWSPTARFSGLIARVTRLPPTGRWTASSSGSLRPKLVTAVIPSGRTVASKMLIAGVPMKSATNRDCGSW